ncbi:MAG: hypothetical protein QF415_14155 [Candidatus Undinarchaeales archaeon]|nr:hypothetical protein [Candidatus Undinarchaeales archaeon]MDP7494457.1 hypothetical protein [Candidatus Undinarchaeales archaeon]
MIRARGRSSAQWRMLVLVVLFILLARWYRAVAAEGFVHPWYDGPRHLRIVQTMLGTGMIPLQDTELSFNHVAYPPGLHILVTNIIRMTGVDPQAATDLLLLSVNLWALGIVYLITKGLTRSLATARAALLLACIYRPLFGLSGNLFGFCGLFALILYQLHEHQARGSARAYHLCGILLSAAFVIHHATYSYAAGVILVHSLLMGLLVRGRADARAMDGLSLIVYPWVLAGPWWGQFSVGDFIAFYTYPLSTYLAPATGPGTVFLALLGFMALNVVHRSLSQGPSRPGLEIPFSLTRALALLLIVQSLIVPAFSSGLAGVSGSARRNLVLSAIVVLYLSSSNDIRLLTPLLVLVINFMLGKAQGSVVGRGLEYWFPFLILAVAAGVVRIRRHGRIAAVLLAFVLVQTLHVDDVVYGTNPWAWMLPTFRWTNQYLPDADIVSSSDYLGAFRRSPVPSLASRAIVESGAAPPPGAYMLVQNRTHVPYWTDVVAADRVYSSGRMALFKPLRPPPGDGR